MIPAGSTQHLTIELARTARKMPHTTTKNARTKRVDTRPNEKRRRKKNQSVEDAKAIQDLRVTRKQKHERKERDVGITALRETAQGSTDKYIRALRKKLQQIDGLMTRQKAGQDLDAQQLAKIDTLDDVMAEMETAIAKSAVDNGDNEADGNEDEGEDEDEDEEE